MKRAPAIIGFLLLMIFCFCFSGLILLGSQGIMVLVSVWIGCLCVSL